VTSPRRRRFKRPSIKILQQRFNKYHIWISDDIAQAMSNWMPLTSVRGKKILRYMRNRVRLYMRDNPDISRGDAVDDVTTQVLQEIENDEVDDPSLLGLTSPGKEIE